MTFKEAKRQLRKVGTGRAQGDALRAMYAEMIAFKWHAIGNPEKFYVHLQAIPDDEQTITEHARQLLRNSNMALDVVLG
jgi:hypothetical protein